jgi:alpha-tubulin suppressor-like RCC1 family protein
MAVAVALGAAAAGTPALAAVRATAEATLHVQYRGDQGLPFFKVTNASTAGETLGSVLLTPPGPAWSIRACGTAPPGWTAALSLGSCVYRSAPGRLDDIAAAGTGTFHPAVDIVAGSTNASGTWDVRVAADVNVSADSVLASGGEGGLAASIWVWEVLGAVVSASQVSPGASCPSEALQAPVGATRTIAVCGRSHATVALTPQAAASSLGGTFVAAPGTFSSRSAAAGFSGVLATWDGATVTSTSGSAHTVRATIGSSNNATSPATDLQGYVAAPPVAAPQFAPTIPLSPANINVPRIGGTAPAGTTVRLYIGAACSGTPVMTDTALVFAVAGFAIEVADNTSTTFRATATDGLGTVSPCSSAVTYVEDSAAPAFAGVRTATPAGVSAIHLGWLAASDAVSPAADLVYEVCGTSVSGGCSAFQANNTSPAGASAFDVTGLLPDTRYFFVVRVRDRAGNRDLNTVQVTARTLGTRPTVNVTAGGGHACALGSDGAVTCWGRNNYGQVGRGTVSLSSAPTVVLQGAVAVSASIQEFTCAALSDGRVRCWGKNDRGQLGDGTTINRRSPTEVPGITTAVAVTAGNAHACALLADGTAACWGFNAKGELGDGTTQPSLTPVAVSGLSGATAIAAGSQHTCAIVYYGLVKCWGLNKFGELGDSTNEDRPTPVEVSALNSVTAIAAGHWHTCALLAEGAVYCWGRGETGQIGNGDTDDQNVPVPVSMPSDIVSISAGGRWDRGWSCAVTAGGFARCWGANSAGNFGTGDVADANPTPVTVTAWPDMAVVAPGADFGCFLLAHGSLLCAGLNDTGQLGDTALPNPSPTLQGVPLTRASMGVRVSSGERHTCAIVSDGTVRCWGHNGSGRLGNGTNAASSIPVPVAGVTGARSISAGGAHTCAVVADGTVRCWGYNGSGQLGDGGTTDRWLPVTVSGLSNAVAVASGAAFTCVLDAFGRVWCFGDDSHHQLGDGGWTAQSRPIEVTGLGPVAAITAGANHACAILPDGWAACWGDETSGQVGPMGSGRQFGFVPGATAIAAGRDHTCALLADGTVNCWGANAAGQLGDNTTTPTAQPVVVAGITNATAIAVGASHTCALLSDTSVRCWGANASGQLGGGSTTPVTGKVVVTNLGATAIDAGLDHTCALVVDGTARCWGAGADGRLGNGSAVNQPTRVQVTPFP